MAQPSVVELKTYTIKIQTRMSTEAHAALAVAVKEFATSVQAVAAMLAQGQKLEITAEIDGVFATTELSLDGGEDKTTDLLSELGYD